MTPTLQRTNSDCTQAALASLLDKAYDDLPAICANNPDAYNRAVFQLLEQEGYFMLSVPPDSIGRNGVRFMEGKTNCLLTVKSKRFLGEHHHICAEILVTEKEKMMRWTLKVIHDPYQLDDQYDVVTIDFVIKRLQ